jgi:MoaA/NifB/PqqE/SkfB family radical SAM enzyme
MKRIPGFNSPRQAVERKVVEKVLSYAGKNGENLPRLIDAALPLVRSLDHREKILKARDTYLTNPVIREYINLLAQETHPNVQRRLIYNWFVNAIFRGVPYQREMESKLGINIPNFILVDPTSACNLRCAGCWAGNYERERLDWDTLERLCREANELGIYWFVFSGGEPFLSPHLLELARRHQDMAFMAYTNGTLIDEKVADDLQKAGNLTPAFSLEGWEKETDARRGEGVFQKVVAAMGRLRERGVIFGVSLTITAQNIDTVTSDEFIDFLIEQGARYGWSFHYIPIGRNPDTSLLLSPEQRAYLAERIPHIRASKPFMIADFWNDGELSQGCLAGGRRYFHVNAAGEAEPCAFVHFATHNVKSSSLLEILQSPLFQAYRKRQAFSDNHLRPCPIIDVPQALRDIVTESNARPTHVDADKILSGEIADFLDERSQQWRITADQIWSQRKEREREGAQKDKVDYDVSAG